MYLPLGLLHWKQKGFTPRCTWIITSCTPAKL